jgi:hypothetical protein
MNVKRLRIYLDDHLALMVGETELIRRCLGSNEGSPLGEFLRQLHKDVAVQKSVAQDIIHRISGKITFDSRLKQGAAWFAEKAGRFKMNGSFLSYSGLSRLVELETLAAAAQERVGFWDNLDAVARHDSRLAAMKCSSLRDQSQGHLNELNIRRRFAAVEAFAGGQTERWRA